MRVILEALDAEILLGEFLVLNGGAHGAVQHQKRSDAAVRRALRTSRPSACLICDMKTLPGLLYGERSGMPDRCIS